MTALILMTLIYLVMGGLTALEVRTIGFPDAMHICSPYDGCPEETRWTRRCPRRRAGGSPLTLFAWVGTLTAWPILWLYGAAYAIVGVLLWIGTRRI